MPHINSTLISNLHDIANQSTLQQHLAAAVIQSNKPVSNSLCNADRNYSRRHAVPSLHAEARAILSYYGKNIYYSRYKGWCFYDENYQNKKIDVVVIRVSRNGCMANARPCRKCLSMMRNLGVKRVHYSSGLNDEIISENIKDMFSIQDSSSARNFERRMYNYPLNDKEYYKFILKKSAPDVLKRSSLDHFIRFNLNDLLPSCNYYFYSQKGNRYFKIEDEENKDFTILIRIL